MYIGTKTSAADESENPGVFFHTTRGACLISFNFSSVLRRYLIHFVIFKAKGF